MPRAHNIRRHSISGLSVSLNVLWLFHPRPGSVQGWYIEKGMGGESEVKRKVEDSAKRTRWEIQS